MSFADEYDFELLENEAEKVVIKELEKQLAGQPEDICRCNDCVLDMVACALNNVKPLYRFSLLGSIYTSQAMSIDAYAQSVQKAVAQAIQKVKKNPSHD
jgi:competence protein ComFB